MSARGPYYKDCPDYYWRAIPRHFSFGRDPGFHFVSDTSHRKSTCTKISLREYFLLLKLLPQKMHFFPLLPTMLAKRLLEVT